MPPEIRAKLKEAIIEFLNAGGKFNEINRILRNTPKDEFINKLKTITKEKMDTNELKDKAVEAGKVITEEAKHIAADVKEGAEHAVDFLKEGAGKAVNKLKGLFGGHSEPEISNESKKA